MTTQEKTMLTVQATVNAPIEKVWQYWGAPEHITKWSTPSEDWHTPTAENDLRTGGSFVSRMEAKDGSMGFDFGGVYDDVRPNEYIEYTLGDGRKVNITFTTNGGETTVVENFEPESMNPHDFQQAGWQAIMNNFKTYTENN